MSKKNYWHRSRNKRAELAYSCDKGFGVFAPKLAQGKRITTELVNQWYQEASEKGRNENDK